jgi:hypothetical protein
LLKKHLQQWLKTIKMILSINRVLVLHLAFYFANSDKPVLKN